MTLFLFVCMVTNSVLYNVDFRKEALKGIDIVGAGAKSRKLASAE